MIDNIGAIVQARLSSKRLPGKVLFQVDGRPIIQYILDRLNRCRNLSGIIVATSIDDSDYPLVKYCHRNGIDYHRGSLEDVAGRFVSVVEKYGFDIFVRVNGDSPLIDHKLIDKAIEIFRDGKYDIVTNVMPRTYPSGQSVEVIDSKKFVETYYSELRNSDTIEHFTQIFYKNSDRFKIFNFQGDINYNTIKLSIDDEEDIRIFKSIINKMETSHWKYGMDEIIKMYNESIKEIRK